MFFFVLTGDPGIGKTTLIKKICAILKERGVKTSGFYTEEVRCNGVRQGFDVVSLEGARGQLARDERLLQGQPVKFKVGKYAVLVDGFEKIALPSIRKRESQSVLVIDEIGKMELFSDNFKSLMREMVDGAEDTSRVVLATVPARRIDPLIEDIRNSRRSKIWLITRENRNEIHDVIANEIIIHATTNN